MIGQCQSYFCSLYLKVGLPANFAIIVEGDWCYNLHFGSEKQEDTNALVTDGYTQKSVPATRTYSQVFSWQSVDLPILISYYITKSNTYDFEVFGGPYLSIPISSLNYEDMIFVTSSKASGSISEADNSDTYTITNKVIPGIEAGTSIAFGIGKATKCIMDVSYIADLMPITIDDNNKLLYRRGLNCNIGLLFSF